MIQWQGTRISLMVMFAICVHYMWGIGLLIDPQGINATALFIFAKTFGTGPYASAVLCWVVASLALLSLFMRSNRFTITLMLPQQATLLISAYGALEAITLGHFGDGVARPVAFIMNDQGWAVLAAIFHTMAIIGRTNEINGDYD